MDSSQSIGSVLKASDILICVCRGDRKVSDIARKLKINKTTVYRVLNSFEHKGIVAKDPVTHHYFPGPFLQALAVDTTKVHDILIHAAADEMETLCHAVDETISLVVPNESQWLSIKVVHSYHQMALSVKAGDSGPIYIGAVGKTLLAQFRDQDLNPLLAKIRMVPFTHTTTTDKLTLMDELIKIRDQGYCVTFSELFEGGAAMGVPIKNYTCPVALCAVGFEASLSKKTELILSNLMKSQQSIEARLLSIASAAR